jgi:hypothetical protein
MSTDVKWAIEIFGDKMVLKDLSEYNTDERTIVQQGDRFFLMSEIFESVSSPGNIKEKTTELLDILSACAELFCRSRVPFRCGDVCQFDENRNIICTFYEREISFSTNIACVTSVKLRDSNGKIKLNSVTPFLHLIDIKKSGESDTPLKDLLYVLGNRDLNSLHTLSFIIELLRKCGYGNVLDSAEYKSRLSLLNKTANSTRRVEDDPRHYEKFEQVGEMMELPVAKSLVTEILRKSLSEKK